MERCEFADEHLRREPFIGSLGINYPYICDIEKCLYNNLNEKYGICRTEGYKISDMEETTREIIDLAKKMKGIDRLLSEDKILNPSSKTEFADDIIY